LLLLLRNLLQLLLILQDLSRSRAMLRSFLTESLVIHRSILKAIGEVPLRDIGERLGAAILASHLLIVRCLCCLIRSLDIAQSTRSGLRHVGGPHRRSSADVAENSPQSAHCDDLMSDPVGKI
jgi:hypothetical protein